MGENDLLSGYVMGQSEGNRNNGGLFGDFRGVVKLIAKLLVGKDDFDILPF